MDLASLTLIIATLPQVLDKGSEMGGCLKVVLGVFFLFMVLLGGCISIASNGNNHARSTTTTVKRAVTSSTAVTEPTTTTTVPDLTQKDWDEINRELKIQADGITAMASRTGEKMITVYTSLYPKESNGPTAVGYCNTVWWALQDAGFPKFRVIVLAQGEKELAAVLTNPASRNGLAPCDDTSGMSAWERVKNTESGDF